MKAYLKLSGTKAIEFFPREFIFNIDECLTTSAHRSLSIRENAQDQPSGSTACRLAYRVLIRLNSFFSIFDLFGDRYVIR